MKTETVKFIKEVPIADADGVPIREGSVLREINDGERGVVVRIIREGDMGTPFDAVGDLNIRIGLGNTRCTNRYNQWRHIPHNEQSYNERFTAWMKKPYDHDTERQISKDEGVAIDGIMALLPDDVVNWDYGPWPDRLEDALSFLVAHLSNQK